MIKRIRLQPLVSLKNNVILGYEALYRKPLLSKYPSAISIIRALFKNYRFFKTQLYINMTPNDAVDPNFATDLLAVLDEYKIDKEQIVLELSESTNPEFLNIIKENLNTLHQNGVKLALDDFGTKYSTLTFLQEFPIDIVKIDQKFVQQSSSCPKASAIMKFAIQVSHDIGCKVVAEGIENLNTLNYVANAGAEIGQGFIFSAFRQKPTPFVNFHEILSGLVKRPLKACYCL